MLAAEEGHGRATVLRLKICISLSTESYFRSAKILLLEDAAPTPVWFRATSCTRSIYRRSHQKEVGVEEVDVISSAFGDARLGHHSGHRAGYAGGRAGSRERRTQPGLLGHPGGRQLHPVCERPADGQHG